MILPTNSLILRLVTHSSRFVATPPRRTASRLSGFFRRRQSDDVDEVPGDEESLDERSMQQKIHRSKILGKYEKSTLMSIAATGLGKTTRSYTPPSDVVHALGRIWHELFGEPHGESLLSQRITDPERKGRFLNACAKHFQHSLPNSQLHSTDSIDDVRAFYETPIRGSVGVDALAERPDLPPNVHVITEPVYFHPETDSLFDKVTAFPFRSTYSYDLKERRKYPTVTYRADWPRSIDQAVLRREDTGFAVDRNWPIQLWPDGRR